MTGTAGQKRVPVDYFAFNPFPLPPLAEQKRIVAKIDQLMLLCDQLELQRNERTQKIIQVNTAAINRLLTVADKVSFNTSWPFIIQHFSELYSVTENVTELKKAILQLAMMGKLVSQDPKDQPAQELLREILIEKNRLIKEGKIQRQSPLPQIHPTSIPFDVPKGWEWTKIDDIAYVIQGQSPPSSTYNESRDGLPFYQGKLEFGKLFPTPRKWCSSPSKISEKGDVLISVRAPVGPTNICMETSCIGRGLAAVRGLGGIETLFMLYLFRTFEQKLSGQGTGTTFNAITGDKLRGFVIPVPPLAEQKRIVSKIETLIELCDSLDRQLRIATMKRTAIYDAVLAKV
jgi:type I restriction enzyme S subunit